LSTAIIGDTPHTVSINLNSVRAEPGQFTKNCWIAPRSRHISLIYHVKGCFWPVKSPTCDASDIIGHTFARGVPRFGQKAGYLPRNRKAAPRARAPRSEARRGRCNGRDYRCSYRSWDRTYRLTFGPNAGRKSWQMVPVRMQWRIA